MADRKTPDPAGQPPHVPAVSIHDEADGCQTLAFRHITEAERIRILRALRAAHIPIPPSLELKMRRRKELPSGGRHKWSGSYFRSSDDFLDALRQALRDLFVKECEPTRSTILQWLAENRHPNFRDCEEGRVSEWCKRAGVSLAALKQETEAEYRGRSAYSRRRRWPRI
jgi:hypothetical protein